MSDKLKAAEELIRATDNARELAQVGKLSRQDMERVQAADKAWTDAKR